jgi:hypothetical protein
MEQAHASASLVWECPAWKHTSAHLPRAEKLQLVRDITAYGW